MPHSRHRHKHSHRHQNPAHAHGSGSRRKASGILSVFMAILGGAIALLSVGTDWAWIAVGALAGLVAGYFLGRFIDRNTQ